MRWTQPSTPQSRQPFSRSASSNISSMIRTRADIPLALSTRSVYSLARLFQISFRSTTEFAISVNGGRKNRYVPCPRKRTATKPLLPDGSMSKNSFICPTTKLCGCKFIGPLPNRLRNGSWKWITSSTQASGRIRSPRNVARFAFERPDRFHKRGQNRKNRVFAKSRRAGWHHPDSTSRNWPLNSVLLKKMPESESDSGIL